MYDKDIIKEAVKEALADEIKRFYVDREQHYQDHLFIKDFRDWCQGIKSTIWKTLAKIVVTIVIGLIVLGFILWGRANIK